MALVVAQPVPLGNHKPGASLADAARRCEPWLWQRLCTNMFELLLPKAEPRSWRRLCTNKVSWGRLFIFGMVDCVFVFFSPQSCKRGRARPANAAEHPRGWQLRGSGWTPRGSNGLEAVRVGLEAAVVRLEAAKEIIIAKGAVVSPLSSSNNYNTKPNYMQVIVVALCERLRRTNKVPNPFCS